MTSIIVRCTPDNKPIIFLLDSLDFSTKHIDVYNPETQEISATTLDFYKTTKSVSDEVEATQAANYVKKFGMGVGGFVLRRKMYRTSLLQNMHKPAPEATITPKQDEMHEIKELIEVTPTPEEGPPYTEDVFQRKLHAAHEQWKERLIRNLSAAISEAIRDTM
jgi:hypothetical protein